MVPEKGPIVELLRSQFKSLDFLGSSLTPKEWHTPASLPGWVVFDVYAHIIGTESMLEGYELPYTKVDVESLSHVHNEIGAFNETWIESLSHLAPAALLDRFRRVTASRLRTLEAMTQKEFEAETETPTGPAPYWRFMQIRVFDCWMHEQDIREGLGRPGHESGPCARASVDEVVRALGYIIGKKAAAEDGSSVTIELTGPVKRTIHVVVHGRAKVVDELSEPATATIAMSSSLFMRLAGGRASNLSNRLGDIDFSGDLALAERVVKNLAFTI
ncbi:MAG: maleylpyruvate isomerase family mycothiol-dependent enzyme [Acidimicrobiia bacterium]|nr:maleylpyruvate isomerase family mycothiol-dependent enzyme [Acidimicrobiia bacterium]